MKHTLLFKNLLATQKLQKNSCLQTRQIEIHYGLHPKKLKYKVTHSIHHSTNTYILCLLYQVGRYLNAGVVGQGKYPGGNHGGRFHPRPRGHGQPVQAVLEIPKKLYLEHGPTGAADHIVLQLYLGV